ncbi:hypothetical protein Patl1_29070 [Pistacia atlantica]|uniref:Uncharacterized protein n=1 Tax=Pistacia atlantica TaxID=434234 RepID=A0ACC1BG01_9ROSI|nr:hypothetical protein Patl1_29070 [Pistacia atlantica]
MKRTKGCQDLHGMERDAQNTARQAAKEQNISGLSKGIDSQRLRSLGKMPPKHPFPSKVSCACEVFSEYNMDTLREQRDILKEEMASLMITPSSNLNGQHRQEEDEESHSLFFIGDQPYRN